jgi:NTP pyrophosphatase (non-canonical NTP hydrolase)
MPERNGYSMDSNFRCPTCGKKYALETDLLTNRSELIPTCDCKNTQMEITRPTDFNVSANFIRMFDQVQEYHTLLGQRRVFDSQAQKVASSRNIALAIMMELAELVDSIQWKPWRELADQPFDRENIKREIVDILFFLVAFCEDYEITGQELYDKFQWVLAHNYERLTNGYSKKNFKKGGDDND